ncbi:hypothetical protein MC885_015816 [Smutsia gigantea]|nr:hypothetical protein MC885_015816 [Smutsia gigantea]
MGVLVVLLGILSFLGGALGGSSALPWYSTSCYLARPIAGSPLGSLSFLGKDAQGQALFHARWDGHGRLQVCSQQDELELIEAFSALCAGEITRGSFIHTPGPELQRALVTLQSQWAACQRPTESPARAREKRATGQSRPAGIGHQRGPDLCCREHDLCPQNISPFQYNYGIRNYRFHTISHCDCDARFQQCLKNQQDSVSDIVGVAFFNVLETPCFVLEEQEACVAWYWWGGCRTYGSIPLARLKPRTLYNASWSSQVMPLTPSPEGPGHSKPPQKQCPQKRPPQRTGSKHPSKANTTALQDPMASPRPDVAPTTQLKVTYLALQGPWGTLKPQGTHRACRIFRRLDQCEHQIGPQETKFQLFNNAHERLFHCNCTRRLARFLRFHSPPTGTNALWELLGMTCFKLAPPLDCAEGQGCSRDLRAVKVSARHLRRLQRRRLQLQGTGTDERQAWPSEHPRGPLSFYDRCLRLTQAAWRPDGQQKSWNQ